MFSLPLCLCTSFENTYSGSNVPFGQSNSNDLYLCHVKTCTWRRLETGAEAASDFPCPRYGHTMVKRYHELYVFAGTAGCVYFNDLYRLNLQTMIWSRVCLFENLSVYELRQAYIIYRITIGLSFFSLHNCVHPICIT